MIYLLAYVIIFFVLCIVSFFLYQVIKVRLRLKKEKERVVTAQVGNFGKYEYKEWLLTTKDGVQVMLTELLGGYKTPVICLPGSYTKRNFYVSSKGLGSAPYLRDQGYRVFILEHRGHGRSPKTSQFDTFSAEKQMKFDLPAAHNFVKDHCNATKVAYLCHSMGGMNFIISLANGFISQDEVSLGFCFGTQYSHGKKDIKSPITYFCYKLLVYLFNCVPAPLLGMGPEVESIGWAFQLFDWFRQSKWIDDQGVDLLMNIKKITKPSIYCFSSPGDHIDPAEGCKHLFDQLSCPKKFYMLGKATGYEIDYSHVQLLVSKQSSREVFPLLKKHLDDI